MHNDLLNRALKRGMKVGEKNEDPAPTLPRPLRYPYPYPYVGGREDRGAHSPDTALALALTLARTLTLLRWVRRTRSSSAACCAATRW